MSSQVTRCFSDRALDIPVASHQPSLEKTSDV
jgi:hypothetical protein